MRGIYLEGFSLKKNCDSCNIELRVMQLIQGFLGNFLFLLNLKG